MRLSSLLYFYRLRLRTRWVQELFALVGIAGGVALLFAAQVANTSLTGSVQQLVDATVGRAELAVTARTQEGFDERVVDRIREAPGVQVAAPLLEVRADVVHGGRRESLTILGADRSLTGLGGSLLNQLRDAPLPTDRIIGLPAPIVARLDASIGGPIRIEAAGHMTRAHLGASLSRRELRSLTESPIAVAPLRYAQRLGGREGRVTRVLIRAEPGQLAAVERDMRGIAGGSLNVRAADFDLELVRQAAAPTSQSTAIFAGMSALVGFLFAFNAMLLTLTARRQLIVALRDDGYAPATIVEVAMFDALVLGVAASGLGLLLGDVLSRELFSATPGYLSLAFPIGGQRVVEWQTVVLSGIAGVTAAVLAALLPLRDLFRPGLQVFDREGRGIRPDRARVALAVGLVCLVVSLVLSPASPAPAVLAVGLLVVALMLCLPAFVLGALWVAGRVLAPIRSAIPMISLGELRAMPTRSIAVAATGALAVFASVASQGARSDLQAGLDRSTEDVNAVTDIWVAPPGAPNMLATDLFEPGDAPDLAAVPGVRSVSAYRSGFLDIGTRRVWVLAQPADSPKPIPPTQLLAGDLEQAERRLARGGWAVVSDGIAAAQGLGIGDRIVLPAAHPRTFRVAALSTNIGWPPGTIVIGSRDFTASWGTTDPAAYQLRLEDGASPAEVRTRVVDALGPASALGVETTATRMERHRSSSRQALSRLSELSILVLVAAVLALAAATGGMVWQRRRRLASLKLDGFEDATVWRALLLESTILLGTGCLVGAVFGLCGQQVLDRALATVTGFPVVHSFGLGFALLSVALVTGVAVAVAGLPGYLAARVAPATALQD